ncbi:GTPase Era [Marinomonas atlantica]|uniref:GTPase Era n=1 Tax=Marinomonas atlantica TaxID=1806668 RepID=UPI0008350E72|nr:GTPase Era [Marinomonas atlantica]MCO4785153.1 GTPase Era [Marinomonas atlantica]
MDHEEEYQEITHCGFVAIVGRPNVGKSTLMNHILGQKLSITSRKPQTTRDQILGVQTKGHIQTVYVDTPGLHKGQDKAINRYMNRTASSALKDVDVVLFVIDAERWTEEDDNVLAKVRYADCPVVLVVNKVDQLDDKEELLPKLAALSEKMTFSQIIPISALRNKNLDRLESLVESYIPEGEQYYPEDQITNRSSRFLASEIVREKITRQLGQEVPYEVAVQIEEFVFEGATIHISALILVERDGQKRIIIGDKGSKIKLIGKEARIDMENLFQQKVMLNLWVKVRSGWSDDERALASLGYQDD